MFRRSRFTPTEVASPGLGAAIYQCIVWLVSHEGCSERSENSLADRRWDALWGQRT